jgi:hypothetical protein
MRGELSTPRYTPPAPANFRAWKHSLQKTGRPCVGLNGTVVSLPQAEHMVVVSTRSRGAEATGRAARFDLQDLQRFGSFLKFLSAKNCCSPAVQTNSAPQSTHLRILSWNSIGRYLVGPARSSSAPVDPRKTLLQLAPELLPIPLTRESLLGSTLVPRLQVKGMLLDVLDDVFLLDLSLESPERALDRFALLDLHFCHYNHTPFMGGLGSLERARLSRANADSRRIFSPRSTKYSPDAPIPSCLYPAGYKSFSA